MRKHLHHYNQWMMSSIGWLHVVLGCVLFLPQSHAGSQYFTRVWQVEEGLPHNNVQAIIQTSDGYLWLGTQNGLARFNGIAFTVFNSTNCPQLRSANITALCEDRDHSLWIGTKGGGLVRFKDGVFLPINFADFVDASIIRAIFQASDGTLWIGTARGVCWVKGNQFQRALSPTESLVTDVRVIAEDLRHNIYFGTGKNVKMWKDGLLFDLPSKSAMANIRTIYRDRAGNMWCAANRSLVRIDSRDPTQAVVVQGLLHSFVSAIFESRSGNLWLGTFGGVNYRETNGTFVEIKNRGEPFDLVNALLEDREGNIWVGDKNGLTQLRPEFVSTYTTQQGLRNNNIASVHEDGAGTMWVGTWGGGLAQIGSNNRISFPDQTGFAEDPAHMLIAALLLDRLGNLWFSAEDTGLLHCVRNGAIQSYGAKQGYIDKVAKVIRQDRAGNYWIGTRSALCRFDGRTFTRFTRDTGLVGNVIRDILEDKAGNLWIATQTGLGVRRDGKFSSFTTRDGLPDDSINCIQEDNEGVLWFGTDDGLARCKDGKFAAVKRAEGLFAGDVVAILGDNDGRLWMSSSAGVFSVSKSEINAVMNHSKSRFQCISYGKAEGMITASGSGFAQPSAWKAADGRLWFATAKGVSVIDPRNTKTVNALPPPIVIEKILADKSIIEQRNLNAVIFPPGRGELEFHYAALSLTAPEKNRFRYKLEGADSDWVDAETRLAAFYNNLSPGRYTFQVTACNNDGVWNPSPTVLTFVLRPHYWQTWWFKWSVGAISICVVAAAARAVTRQRMRLRFQRLEQQHAVEKERVRIAQDMHDDLGARLTEILLMNSAAKKSGSLEQAIGEIGKTSVVVREVIDNLDALVWVVNPGNDSLAKLAGYLYEYAGAFLKAASIACRLDTPATLPPISIPSETRHNVFLIVKEALNNAVKYSSASEVWLRLHLERDTLHIRVEDNGKGFCIDDAYLQGNGLQNMQKRAERIGGTFVLCSEPEKGTRIHLQVLLSGVAESSEEPISDAGDSSGKAN
jgi:ligand-binding sensor domain-containing protein/signal transduction histidine kinase